MGAIFTPQSTVSHPEVVPYISISDYLNAPTGVDTSALSPAGGPLANSQEIANVVRRASAWVNNLCFQILAATEDIQTASSIRVRRDGTVRVMCDFWPVIEVDSFSVGRVPSVLAPIADVADMWLDGRKVLVVPVSGVSGGGLNSGLFGAVRPGDRVYCLWSYWNGWLHTTLASSVAAGATSLLLSTPLPAAAAGQVLTLWDAGNTERVQIAPAFAGGTSAPLIAPVVKAHTLPVAPDSIMLSTLPDDVRQATISLTSALIKTRGAESYEMAAVGQEPSKSDLIEGGGMEDLAVAVDLLDRYKRTV